MILHSQGEKINRWSVGGGCCGGGRARPGLREGGMPGAGNLGSLQGPINSGQAGEELIEKTWCVDFCTRMHCVFMVCSR